MSIKWKIILSNIIMIAVPVLFILLMQSFLTRDTIRRQPMLRIHDIETIAKKTEYENNMSAIIEFCKNLESATVTVALTNADGIVYQSKAYEAGQIPAALDKNTRQVTVVKGNETVTQYQFHINGQQHLLTIADSNISSMRNKSFEEFQADMLRNGMIQITSTIIIIIITNIVLTVVMSKSILKPLSILQAGANFIKMEDFDQPVIYVKNDEFGKVCTDLEQMRLRLKHSVSERHKYEENRKELIAGMSHDLLTPLTRIKGYVAGLLDGVANTPDKIRDYLHTINQTVITMQKLVDNLFLFSKLDMNNIPFYLEKTDLSAYFQDCYEELHIGLAKQDLILTLDITENEVFAQIDRFQFRRVITNIVENSVKYKKEGIGKLQIQVLENPKSVLICFKDQGIGMAPEYAAQIFDIFYRIDPARSDTQKGSGLGLAIVKQIVQLHKGSVAASSETGKGLEIVITIPKEEEVKSIEKDIDY